MQHNPTFLLKMKSTRLQLNFSRNSPFGAIFAPWDYTITSSFILTCFLKFWFDVNMFPTKWFNNKNVVSIKDDTIAIKWKYSFPKWDQLNQIPNYSFMNFSKLPVFVTIVYNTKEQKNWQFTGDSKVSLSTVYNTTNMLHFCILTFAGCLPFAVRTCI